MPSGFDSNRHSAATQCRGPWKTDSRGELRDMLCTSGARAGSIGVAFRSSTYGPRRQLSLPCGRIGGSLVALGPGGLFPLTNASTPRFKS